MNPEFLREGSGIRDFFEASRTVVGVTDDRTYRVVAELYDGLDVPMHRTSIRTAELAKYADNAFHATKIVFANELAAIAQRSGVDGREVMSLLAADDRLNISAAYLRPGFAFGGSCLPKDVRALVDRAAGEDIKVPLLDSILPSNQHHLRRALDLIERAGEGCIGVYGLSFKASTDDLRESPAVTLVERLLSKGRQVVIFDGDVRPGALRGANRAYMEERMPFAGDLLLGSLAELVGAADVLVITKPLDGDDDLWAGIRPHQVVVDLVGVPVPDGHVGRYMGIAW